MYILCALAKPRVRQQKCSFIRKLSCLDARGENVCLCFAVFMIVDESPTNKYDYFPSNDVLFFAARPATGCAQVLNYFLGYLEPFINNEPINYCDVFKKEIILSEYLKLVEQPTKISNQRCTCWVFVLVFVFMIAPVNHLKPSLYFSLQSIRDWRKGIERHRRRRFQMGNFVRFRGLIIGCGQRVFDKLLVFNVKQLYIIRQVYEKGGKHCDREMCIAVGVFVYIRLKHLPAVEWSGSAFMSRRQVSGNNLILACLV